MCIYNINWTVQILYFSTFTIVFPTECYNLSLFTASKNTCWAGLGAEVAAAWSSKHGTQGRQGSPGAVSGPKTHRRMEDLPIENEGKWKFNQQKCGFILDLNQLSWFVAKISVDFVAIPNKNDQLVFHSYKTAGFMVYVLNQLDGLGIRIQKPLQWPGSQHPERQGEFPDHQSQGASEQNGRRLG